MIIGYKKSNILIYFLGNQFYSIANVVMFAVVSDLMGIKQRLYQFYELVNDSGIKEFQKAIETFKNWQTYIMAILKALIIKPKSLSAMHLDFVVLFVLDYVYYFIISIKK